MLSKGHRSRRTLLAALAISAVGHGALVVLLSLAPPPKPKATNEPVEFEVVRVEPPPPPPAEPEPEPEPEPEAPKPKPKPIAKVEVKREPERPLPPPPPNAPPPPESAAPPAPIRIGVSLSSTTEGGGFAVGTGNSLYGTTERKAGDPSDVRPYAAQETKKAAYVPSSQVSTLPRVIGRLDVKYPEEERSAGIEGSVIYQVRIDETGKVASLVLVQGIGQTFDKLAADALRRARFQPATLRGEPVATEIRYSVTFELDR